MGAGGVCLLDIEPLGRNPTQHPSRASNSQTANRDSQIRFFVTEDILRIITGCVRVSILKVAKNDISGQAIYLAILSRVEFDLLLKSIRIPSTICRETGRWCRPRNRLSCPSLLPSDVWILQVQQDNVQIQELPGKKYIYIFQSLPVSNGCWRALTCDMMKCQSWT